MLNDGYPVEGTKQNLSSSLCTLLSSFVSPFFFLTDFLTVNPRKTKNWPRHLILMNAIPYQTSMNILKKEVIGVQGVGVSR